jgi:hypothetical protein
VLQRDHLAVRFFRRRLPAADRGRVGVRVPRRRDHRLRVWRRPARAGRPRLVQGQRGQGHASGRRQAGQRVGPAGQARQRGGIVPRFLRARLLQDQPGAGSARPGHRAEARRARRELGEHGREMHGVVSRGGCPEPARCLPRLRRLRLPLRPQRGRKTNRPWTSAGGPALVPDAGE